MKTNILTGLIARQAEGYGERVALSAPDAEGKWYDISWNKLSADVDTAAAALAALGIKESDNVATFSSNRPENIISDFACYLNRATTVSIYATSSLEQLAYIINDASCQLLFVGNATQFRIALEATKQCPSLKHIVVIKSIGSDELNSDCGDVKTMTWSDFMKLGSEAGDDVKAMVKKRSAEATPDDLATLVYTSGTTGEPKGAMLTHSNFDYAMESHFRRITMIDESDVSMAFLPLSHIFEKAWTYFCLATGIKVAVNRDPKLIQETIQQVRPSSMCSVPRFWEKVYAAVNEKIATMSPIMRGVVNMALSVGRRRNIDYVRRGKKAPLWLELRYKFFNAKVFSLLRRAIGIDDKATIFPTAGAAVSPKIVEFFHSCGINMVVGYGLSETTATVTCLPQTGWEIGSVGTTIPFVEIKIGENNEILVKSPMVLRGYYNKSEATKEAFTRDGWFRTGDAGYIENGNLYLTDRIKDLFKTSNGKYIAPQMIETLLGDDKYIDQLAVIGDRRKFVSALIVPDYAALKDYATAEGIKYDSMEELVGNERVRALLTERIEGLQKNLASYERIKRFTLLPRPFSMESGELTNTLKVRRHAIYVNYAKEIDAMYED